MVNVGEPSKVEFARFATRPLTIVAIVVITAVDTLAVVNANCVGRANGINGVGKFRKGGTTVAIVIGAVVVIGIGIVVAAVVTIVFNVVVIARIVVAVTLLTTVGGIGAYGYIGHGFAIGGPSIESNTYPISEPAVKPTLYESVIIFPVASLSVAGTLDGANIIGKLPAKPFVMPKAAVKINAGVSPLMIGCDLGAQHSNNNGTREIRIVDSKIN